MHASSASIGYLACLSRGVFTMTKLTRKENITLLLFSSLFTINIAMSDLSLFVNAAFLQPIILISSQISTIACISPSHSINRSNLHGCFLSFMVSETIPSADIRLSNCYDSGRWSRNLRRLLLHHDCVLSYLLRDHVSDCEGMVSRPTWIRV